MSNLSLKPCNPFIKFASQCYVKSSVCCPCIVHGAKLSIAALHKMFILPMNQITLCNVKGVASDEPQSTDNSSTLFLKP